MERKEIEAAQIKEIVNIWKNIDNEYGLLINVRSNGTMAFKIDDSRRFVVNVVGQLQDFTVDGVKKGIKAAILAVIKNSISKIIVEQGVSILEINTKIMEIGNGCLDLINKEIAYLGIELQRFYVNSISCSDEDLAALKDAKAKAASLLVEAQAKAESRRIQGYDYRTERQFDVLDKAASNTGGAAGGLVGAGVGLGTGLGVGGAVGSMTKDALNDINKPAGTICPKCGAQVPSGAKFCPGCGEKVEAMTGGFCPQCGKKLEPGTKFCPQCGTKVGN